MKSYSSREVIKILNENGWYEVRCIGDYHQFKNASGKLVTVTHPENYDTAKPEKYK